MKRITCLQDHFERCRKYSIPYLDQATLQIINVARRRGRQKPRRVIFLRAIEGPAVGTSYHPVNFFQARLEFELHEGSYPCLTRPHHFVVLVLVNSRHFYKSDKKRSARVHLTWSLQRPPVKSRLSRVPWLRTCRAPSTGASYNTGSLLAALSVDSSAGCTRRTVLALLYWCRRPGRGRSCFQQMGTDRSVLKPDSRLTPLGSYTGHEALALVLPVVPYAQALSSNRARPVVSLAPWPIGGQTQAPRCRVILRLSQALLSFTDFK